MKILSLQYIFKLFFLSEKNDFSPLISKTFCGIIASMSGMKRKFT